MQSLADLFTTAGALTDTNGDGYADDIMLRIVVSGAATAWEWCALADFAAVLGLHVTGFSPPLIVDVWTGPTLLLDTTDEATLPAGTGRVTREDAILTVQGGDAAGRAAILRALAQGLPPDASEWQVTIAQYPEPIPQLNPAAPGSTLTLDDLFMTQGTPDRISGLLVDTDGDHLPDDSCCCFVVSEDISREIGAALVDVAARLGVETAGLTVPLCAPIDLGAAVPVLIGGMTPTAMHSDRPFLYQLADGRTAVVIAGETDHETAAALRTLTTLPLIDTTFPAFAEPTPSATMLRSWEWQERSERDVLMEVVQDSLPSLSPAVSCTVRVQVSEDAEHRATLHDALLDLLPAESVVTVLPVHHAGRAWLEEVVAPAAKACVDLAMLEVTSRPLLASGGQTCRDLPIRWLQECWPADELLAPTLNLSREQIQMTLGTADQDEIYHARALDADGKTLDEWRFSPEWYTRPYLPGIPAQGIVHVATGHITVQQGGATILARSLPTDLDRFWDAWQGETLPQLRDFILTDNDGQPSAADQPFFDQLRAEVWVSEPEYALGVREERESPAEGLAEDIYFNTLDFFHALGEQIEGKPWEEPGQVVPLVHVSSSPDEPPRAKVTLLRYDTTKTAFTPIPVQERSTGVAMDEVVTGTNLPGLLAYVNRLPGVTVRDVERSYRGRTIPAIEVIKPDGATVRSRTKLAAMKPTHLIVARHHANEVASTTAAFRFIELLATDPATMPLLDRCNCIFIPDENPDGTALHAMLMAEHPTWKHHAARYNAVGVEFGSHTADPDTPYGEARVRPRLMRQWRADVVTDNHGVPSHEWWQPFAGGQNPPRFRISYWLCQALIYGICRYAPDPPHAAFAAALRETVSRAIGAEPDLAAANRIYAERYARWGSSMCPRCSPPPITATCSGSSIPLRSTPGTATRYRAARAADGLRKLGDRSD